ncbi:MAG: HU family DNA-binding protein [Actinomycetes bacterium]
MNKADLIDAVATRLGGAKRDANDAVEAVLDSITRAVAKGDRVSITGFGSFEKVDRPARFARNPRTGERVRVKKTAVPKFKAGADFKGVVSGAKKLPKAAASTTKSAAAKSTAGARKSSAGARKSPTRKAATTGTRRTTAAKKGTTTRRTTAAKKGATSRKTSPSRKTTARRSAAKKSSARRSR